MSALKLSVVVPCYNEEDGVRELHRRVTSVCEREVNDSYELILVNDGSKDNTGPSCANSPTPMRESSPSTCRATTDTRSPYRRDFG